uniref:Uncharacterized protein n=1 Tax=Rhizophora mucronata TaxID=61149 RepID=A0A2P2IW76_RHIMU
MAPGHAENACQHGSAVLFQLGIITFYPV